MAFDLEKKYFSSNVLDGSINARKFTKRRRKKMSNRTDDWYFGVRGPPGTTPQQRHDLTVDEVNNMLVQYYASGVNRSQRAPVEAGGQVSDPDDDDFDETPLLYDALCKEFRDIQPGQQRDILLQRFTDVFRRITGNPTAVPEVKDYEIQEEPILNIPVPRYRAFNDTSNLDERYVFAHSKFPNQHGELEKSMQFKLRKARAFIMSVYRTLNDTEKLNRHNVSQESRELLKAELFCLLD